MIKNKIMPILCLASAFSTAYAAYPEDVEVSSPVPEKQAVQFYVGVVGGAGFLTGDYPDRSPLLEGGGVLGVQTTFNNHLFAAAQVNGLYHQEGETNIYYPDNFSYGGDLRFGYHFEKAIPYVLAGIEVNRSFLAPKAGVGVLFPLTEHLNLNVEYAYAQYNIKDTVDLEDGEEYSKKWHLGQNHVLLGLNYIF